MQADLCVFFPAISSPFTSCVDKKKGKLTFGTVPQFRDYTYTSKDWNPSTLENALEAGRPGAFVCKPGPS